MNEPFESYLVGRFRIDVPASFVRLGQESRIAGIQVQELSFPSPRPEEEFARFWREKIATIKAPKPDQDPFEIVADRELRPGVRVLEYVDRPSEDWAPPSHFLEAAIVQGNFGAHLKTELVDAPRVNNSTVDYSVLKPLNELNRRNIAAFLDAYRALTPRASGMEEAQTFFLPHGAFAVPIPAGPGVKAGDDSVSAAFEDKKRHMQLSFKASFPYVPQRDRPSMLESVGESLLYWKVKAKVVRAEKRTVAGFAGEELILLAKDEDTLQYTWLRKPGREPSGYDPEIEIEMEAAPGDEPLASAIWDASLNSVKALPSP